MIHLIKSICDWNRDRYDQEFNGSLAHDLLSEEVDELYNACLLDNNDVEIVDALVDIIYVAIGALWKFGFNPDQIHRAIEIVCESNNSKTAAKTEAHIKANINKGDTYVAPTEGLKKLLKEID